MPKYRNTQAFVQPVVIAGKRYLVKPGEVLFSERELDLQIYTFLQLAEDTAPISQVTQASSKQLTGLAKADDIIGLRLKVEALSQAFNEMVKPQDIQNLVSQDELNKKLTAITQHILQQTPQIEEEEFNGMIQRVDEMKKLYDELAENEEIKSLVTKFNEMGKTNELILKRLEIMKNAVEVINQALHNLETEVYFNSNIVVIDDEEKK
jgi:TATA-box binding protein (TBP) (component of TFIID and TFIIIB)